jgi:hypothetical protein
MDSFFIVEIKRKVKGEKQTKIVLERYVCNSETVTEAEARTIGWIPANYGEYTIKGATKSSLQQMLISPEKEKFFVARIGDTIETKGGGSKIEYFQALVNGNDIIDACNSIKANFKGSVSDYHIASIMETKIIYDEDLATYVPKEKIETN